MDALLPSLHALSLAPTGMDGEGSGANKSLVSDLYDSDDSDPERFDRPAKQARRFWDDDDSDESDGEPPAAAAPTVDVESDDEPEGALAPGGPAPAVDLGGYLFEWQKALGTAVEWGVDEGRPDWGRTLLCTYETGTGKTRGALYAAATWIRNGALVSGKYSRLVFCLASKATMAQWVEAWQGLVAQYAAAGDDKFQDLGEKKFKFKVNPQASLMRAGNLVLGTPGALRRYGTDFGKAHGPRKQLMFIYDEAHSVRTLQENRQAKTIQYMLHFAAFCGYVLLLTATPIMNSLSDLNILHAFLNKKTITMIFRSDIFEEGLDMPRETLGPLLRQRFQTPVRRIIYQGADPTRMPRVVYAQPHHVEVSRTHARPKNDKGVEILKQENDGKLERDPFLQKGRLAANKLKYAPLLAHLERPDTARRFVVASSYRGAGVDGFYNFIQKHGFRKVTDEGYEQFKQFPILRRSADDSAIKVRMEVGLWEDSKLGDLYKKWYEDGDSDVIKILLISPMASTGVSLRFTNEIHLLEPDFVPYQEDQIVGRVVRIDSHKGLPEAQRVVTVVRWISVLKQKQAGDGTEHLQSADERVLQINNAKRGLLTWTTGKMQQFGSQNLSALLGRGVVPEGTVVQDVDSE